MTNLSLVVDHQPFDRSILRHVNEKFGAVQVTLDSATLQQAHTWAHEGEKLQDKE